MLQGLHLFLLSCFLLWFGNNLLLLSEDHFNVAWGAHVRVDASVGTVSASAHLWGLVHLDVFDHQRVHIQTLQGINERKKQITLIVRLRDRRYFKREHHKKIK